MRLIDITGNRYGILTVIGQEESKFFGKTKQTMWLCKCDCGNTTIVSKTNLRNGNNISCGCLAKAHSRVANKKHGLSHKERLYGIWKGMKNRCYNKKLDCYKYYGGRGISVCKEWRESYEVFRDWALSNGYKEIILPNGNNKLTIDRINNNGNYEPNNCRWVDMKVQNSNKRNSKIKGEK